MPNYRLLLICVGAAIICAVAFVTYRTRLGAVVRAAAFDRLMTYQGVGEIGGLVAGVGQRILGSVSKHLVGKFFASLRKEFDVPAQAAAE